VRQLPQAWRIGTLGDAIRIRNGYAFKSADFQKDGVPLIRQTNLNGKSVDLSRCARLPNACLSEYQRFAIKCGDILIGMSGSIGKLCRYDNSTPALQNQRTGKVEWIARDSVSERYVWHFLCTIEDSLRKLGKGVAVANVSSKDIESLIFPIAPLQEQRRIAKRLDGLVPKIASCRERLDRVPQILKKFREAVLEAAASGKLTEEWRARIRCDSHDAWSAMKLASVCQPGRIITYGVIKLGADIAGGVPCLRTSDVRWLRIEEDGIKRIAPELSAEYGRTVLRGDEVLVNVRGTLGGVAAVMPHMLGWNVSREVAVVPAAPELIRPRFLALWIATNSSQRWLAGVQKGVAYTGINIEDLRALPVRVPSLNEQSEIVRRVDDLFALADGWQRRYIAALAPVEKLTPSVLAKAFRGELVPQDPNDEPAGEMLERLAQGNQQTLRPRKTSHARG
jgi:type I restriction enzyme S subunit